jgi:hypothetical protein
VLAGDNFVAGKQIPLVAGYREKFVTLSFGGDLLSMAATTRRATKSQEVPFVPGVDGRRASASMPASIIVPGKTTEALTPDP